MAKNFRAIILRCGMELLFSNSDGLFFTLYTSEVLFSVHTWISVHAGSGIPGHNRSDAKDSINYFSNCKTS